jgi:hypothetical protein
MLVKPTVVSNVRARGEMDNDHEPASRVSDRPRFADAPAPPLCAGALGFGHSALFADASQLAPMAAEPLVDSGVSPDALRYEEEQAYFNDSTCWPRSAISWSPSTAPSCRPTWSAPRCSASRARNPAGTASAPSSAPSSCPISTSFISRRSTAPPAQCRVQMMRAGGEPLAVTLLASADGSGQACRVVVERPRASWPRSNAARSASAASCTAPARASGRSTRCRSPPSSIRAWPICSAIRSKKCWAAAGAFMDEEGTRHPRAQYRAPPARHRRAP